ncbi:siderophore-interacting protein [Aeromicrobium endophyticum]|uniref:Siderophore-interacting protein n=1 Tax=Aeromicrobium endophyticum TaxID=2292704 RepID=A0A371P5D8_9ACTN|nr:siderophore-interacting protein [Aeromicrobium endophyticum]REK70676.1 siderophore-interacting protein [Aeromicrobium endophyticum]
MSANRPVRLTVVRTEQLAPSMRRLVLGGDEFETFADRVRALPQRYTDLYVKLVFLADGFEYPVPLDLGVVKETMPQEAWPVLRTYTVSEVDEQERLVTIDFVVHGDEGVAGPWAAAAQPGDTIHLRGPNGGYAPDPSADWHLIVGDESALPAIAASIAALDDEATAVAFVEVDGPADERDLGGPAGLELHWLHRGEEAPGTTTLLDDAVRAMPWREGRVQAFVHGESALLKSVRAYLLRERRVARADVSVSAYWRRGTTEEGFRVWKSQQTDAVMRPST